MARRQTFRRKRRRSKEGHKSAWVSLVLVGLTAVNVYVFFFRDDTSVKRLMKPTATGKAVIEAKGEDEALEEAAKKPSKSDRAGKDTGKDAKKDAKGVNKLAEAPAAAPNAAAPNAAAASVRPTDAGERRIAEGTIGNDDTLNGIIEREGLGASSASVLRALSRLVDPKSLRPGDRYAVAFDGEGTPQSFEYWPSPILRYVVSRGADGNWIGQKEEKPLEAKAVESSGTIDSSLYESVYKAGETGALVGQLVELFAWDINFYVDPHPGDRWKVLVEKQFLDGKFYRYGNILAAEYAGKAGTFRAFAWSAADGRGQVRYFDEHGQAIAKSFLKTPLRFVRISSKFDRNRFHPILHTEKAHLGVDYAAPVGTPVWASASGKVVECGMKPGSGNTVVLQHAGGLGTRYYHLSRFAPGMRAGRQVRQKELIGYVGTTGLSTGPHLHFAVTRNGAFVDPTKLAAVREAPVPDRAAFLAAIKPRLQALHISPGAVAKQ